MLAMSDRRNALATSAESVHEVKGGEPQSVVAYKSSHALSSKVLPLVGSVKGTSIVPISRENPMPIDGFFGKKGKASSLAETRPRTSF